MKFVVFDRKRREGGRVYEPGQVVPVADDSRARALVESGEACYASELRAPPAPGEPEPLVRRATRFPHGGRLTIFAVPYPDAQDEQAAARQRAAVRSWALVEPRPEILLVGDEPGVEELAASVGARAISAGLRRYRGKGRAPLLDSVFELADREATSGLMCFLNPDIVVAPGRFAEALGALPDDAPESVLVGNRWDVDLPATGLPFGEPDPLWPFWRAIERGEALAHAPHGSDWFVFRRGFWGAARKPPPFVVGRSKYDNWLFFDAARRGARVVDCTEIVTVFHLNHPHPHFDRGPSRQVRRNIRLYGKEVKGSGKVWDLKSATHRMRFDLEIVEVSR
jgi:hypothetical protein